MDVEHVDNSAGRTALHEDSGVLGAATFVPTDGQVDIALAAYCVARERRVAILALFHVHIHADCTVRITQFTREVCPQVEVIRTGSRSIHFLQEHDVGIVVSKDFQDALRREHTVNTDGFVNVVSQYAKSHDVAFPCKPLCLHAKR